MTCTSNHGSRRSTRCIRPGERLAESVKELFSHTTTLTTVTSSSKSCSSNSSSFRLSADARFQEFQRKICPVTGSFRDISTDYCINKKILGRGHYGIVRECEHRRARGIVLAVKSVYKSKVRRLDHLRREVYLLSKMNHRGIMRMIDCYEDADCVHIVTEKYAGGELFDQISANTTPSGCFSEQKAARIIKSLLEAVAYLHANDIVHRDIKPENILFESAEEGSAIRLIDFGLSRTHKKNEAPMINPVGTAYYMAPEVLNNSYDRSCDVWSVGTIAYILLSGYPPFNGETDPEIFASIKKGEFSFPEHAWSSKSDEAKDFIDCLLRMDRGKRLTAQEALGHAWLKNSSVSTEFSDAVSQHEDIMARIQRVRSHISKFKKSVAIQR